MGNRAAQNGDLAPEKNAASDHLEASFSGTEATKFSEMSHHELEAYLQGEALSVRWSRLADLTGLFSRLMRETHHAVVLENWGVLWMWHSVKILLQCVLTTWLAWHWSGPAASAGRPALAGRSRLNGQSRLAFFRAAAQ